MVLFDSHQIYKYSLPYFIDENLCNIDSITVGEAEILFLQLFDDGARNFADQTNRRMEDGLSNVRGHGAQLHDPPLEVIDKKTQVVVIVLFGGKNLS